MEMEKFEKTIDILKQMLDSGKAIIKFRKNGAMLQIIDEDTLNDLREKFNLDQKDFGKSVQDILRFIARAINDKGSENEIKQAKIQLIKDKLIDDKIKEKFWFAVNSFGNQFAQMEWQIVAKLDKDKDNIDKDKDNINKNTTYCAIVRFRYLSENKDGLDLTESLVMECSLEDIEEIRNEMEKIYHTLSSYRERNLQWQ